MVPNNDQHEYVLVFQANVSGLKDQMDLVKMCVDFVDSIQFPSGNYPSSLGRDVDRLIHWCHGAPGVIYMLTTAYEVVCCAHVQ